MTKLRFVTRTSLLARQQTMLVVNALLAAHPGLECEINEISTRGDRELSRPLAEIGGKGLFTLELEAEILDGRADAAVHSLKDLPVDSNPALVIGAIPLRAEQRDVLVSAEGYTLSSLPPKARVGTSSPRRAAQLLAFRPDLRIENLRGNVDTRLRKAEQGLYDAIVLAAAGLIRLGREAAISEWLPLDVILPAPGQGALAVQCRKDDLDTQNMLQAIEDEPSRICTEAERSFLAGMGAGCSLPVAASAELVADQQILLRALVAAPDGVRIIRLDGMGTDPEELGARLALQAIGQGASDLLG